MNLIIEKSYNKRENSFFLYLSIALLVHFSIIAVLFCGSFFSVHAMPIDGDNSIKAVMIDLSVMAAPEQSLVENTPQVEKNVDEPITDDEKLVDIKQDEIKKEVEIEPDVIVDKEVVKKLDKPKDPQLVVKDKTVKPKDKNKNSPKVKQTSKAQLKQEVKADKVADVAVAPSISDNTKLSASPSAISRNQPEYPRRALDMRIEGHVIVLFDINNDGRVENIRIVEAKPNNIFNNSVKQAMKSWRYQPVTAKDLTVKIVFNRNKSIKLEST